MLRLNSSMNSQPKIGVIYLIVNIQNYINNVLPYLYIGSKEDESKFDTYWSSSKFVKEDIQKIGKQNFIKIVLEKVKYDNSCDLLEVEQSYHNKLDVVNSPLYYNKAYANGKLVGGPATSDTIWVNNGESEKRVNTSLVEGYLTIGYVVGRQENYNKGRTYVNKNGVVKSITSDQVSIFLKEGWNIGRGSGNQFGKTWIHNDVARKLVPLTEVSTYEASGWMVGCFRNNEKNQLGKNRKPRKQQGKDNPNFGKHWITDNNKNKLVSIDSKIPEGWVKGRVLRK